MEENTWLSIDVSDASRVDLRFSIVDGEMRVAIKKFGAKTGTEIKAPEFNEIGMDDFIETARAASPRQPPILKPSARIAYSADFENFYRAYPNRQNKASAYKAWKKLDPSPALQSQMLRAVTAKSQSKEWLKDGGEFIPHPASWINARRWEDEAVVDVEGDRMRATTQAHVDMMRGEEHFQ